MTTAEFFQYDNHQIFYKFQNYNQNKPLLVFLNGLTDGLESWDKIISNLSTDYSFLTVDLLGQGLTLEEQFKKNVENFNFSIGDQCSVLSSLLNHLNIQQPIHLVGFSYGGGVAIKWASQHPDRIQKLILLLPYIIRLDRAFPMARLWWRQLESLKQSSGFLGRQAQMFDRVYDNFLNHYMHFRYSNHVPEEHLRKAAIELSQEIMKLNVFDHLHTLPEKSTYLITSEKDTLVPNTLYRELWDKLPSNTKQAWIQISNGEHLILEQAPLLVSRWLQKIIDTPHYEGVQTDAV